MKKYKIVPIKVSGRVVSRTVDAPAHESALTPSQKVMSDDAVRHVTVVEKAGARAKHVPIETTARNPSPNTLDITHEEVHSTVEETRVPDEVKPVGAIRLKVKEEKDSVPKTEKATKASKKKAHKDAPDHAQFYFKNGPVVKNLLEFRNALEAISDEQFNHHVEGKRNDFVRWINEVLEDSECANGLCDVTDKHAALEVVRKHTEV